MRVKRLIRSLALILFISAITCLTVKAQSPKPLMKATLPGYPTFVVTDDAMMPLGTAPGGIVTLTKAADNLDQQFNTAMKNKTQIATLDLVVYNSSGQKSKTYHFTKLVVQSLIPNYSGVSAIGFKYDNMTQN